METPFIDAKPILNKLHSSGYEAFFVGGAVRDHLLKREIGDVDIATSAKPTVVQELFDKTIDVGAEHGTIIVLQHGIPYEVTTYRSEAEYENFRRPQKVSYITSLEEDLRRRDFTINAMAMNIDGIIQDYFNGKSHLNAKLIKTVGSPFERFTEDALRMLRAVRFVSQLQFSLSHETKDAIIKNVNLLEVISVERKTVEIEKILKGPNYKEALKLVVETNMYIFLPGLETKQKELIALSSYDLNQLKTKEEIWTLFTYCIAPDSIHTFLREWKLPVKLIRTVEKNIRFLTLLTKMSWNDILLYEAGYDTALVVERIRSNMLNEDVKGNVVRIKKAFLQLPIQRREQLAITGHEVIQYINQKPGPWVSEVIAEVENAILTRKLENTSSAIKEWLTRCKPNFEQNY